MTGAPASPRRSLAPLWGAPIIGLAALAAYADSFRAPYIYDDDASIAHNPTLHRFVSPAVLRPPAGATVSGRPMLNVSLAINYAISGVSVWSYHALNLLIHIAAGLALFGILRRTLKNRPELIHGKDPFWIGLAGALLWTLHPLQTEAVTYVVQRAESLMGLFYLLTLYCFVRGARLCPPDAGSAAAVEPNLWFGLSWLACLLGMATKEVMVTAPVMVLFYDRTFVAGSFSDAWKRRKAYYFGLAATWILLGVLVASTGGDRGGSAGLDVGVPVWAYGLTQFGAICRYLRLAIVPFPLVFEYGTYWVHGILQEVLLYAVVVIGLGAASLAALRRRPALGFLGFWFFGILAPTSLMPGTTQMIVEHRMYLPLAAVVALGAVWLCRRWGRAGLAACFSVAVVFGGMTWLRNRDYRTEESIWADTVAKRPNNPVAHGSLGLAYFHLGQFAAAEAQYRRAIQLAPDYTNAHTNLGLTLTKLGRWREAVPEYREALRESSDAIDAHYHLACALVYLGDWPEAVAEYGAALRQKPGDPDAFCGLGNALSGEGRLAAAAAAYEAALRAEPDHFEAQNNLGLALAALGRLPEAVTHFEAARRIDPGNAQARGNLGLALARLGRIPEAIAEYRAGLRLQPNDAVAEYNLGNALLQSGRPAEAETCYRTALRLKPNWGEALGNLGSALLDQGRFPEAAAAYDGALRLEPNLEAAREGLAFVLRQMKGGR